LWLLNVAADCEGCGAQVDLLGHLYKKIKCVLQSDCQLHKKEMPVVTEDDR